MRFVKYLTDFGVEPAVVTTDLESFRQVMDNPIDESLLRELPERLVIERVPCPRLKKRRDGKFAGWRDIYFSLVEDQARFWRPQLDLALPGLLRRHQPRAIVVSLPPFCMGPLWCDLAKKAGLPVILDFRDAWSQWRVTPYGSWLHYLLTLRLEKKCLAAAGRIVCTSSQTRVDFLRAHPEISPEKIAVITNGYDSEVGDWTPRPAVAGRPFQIGYVGAFYYSPEAREAMMRPWWQKRPNRMIQYAPRREDWLYRSPWFFFQAVARLFSRKPQYKDRLRVRFAGRKPDWIEPQVRHFGLQDNVDFAGQLDHPGVLKFQQECDALLVTSSKVIGGRDYSIAGKTFEYLTMCRPILGFVAEGAQKDLLAASGLALLCDPDAPDDAAQTLADLMDGRVVLTPQALFLRPLHCRELTRRLAAIISETVARTGSPANSSAAVSLC